MGVGVRLAVLAVGPGEHYNHSGWVVAAGAALCMTGLGVIQLVVGPAVLDVDVVLRFATAGLAIVLAALTNVLSPVVILWLLAAGLLAQVVLELGSHERHGSEPAVGCWIDYTPARRLILSGPPRRLAVDQDPAHGGPDA